MYSNPLHILRITYETSQGFIFSITIKRLGDNEKSGPSAVKPYIAQGKNGDWERAIG